MAFFIITQGEDNYAAKMAILKDGFKKLPTGLARKHVKSAMTKAVKELNLVNEFKRVAKQHEQSGALAGSVGVSAGFYQRGAEAGQGYARVGFLRRKGKISKNTGKLTGQKLGNHALLLHFGTKHRFQRTPPHKYCGEGPATHFADPAIARGRAAGTPMLTKHLLNALDAAVREKAKYLEFQKNR